MKVGAKLLFDVLSTAYERQSLIVTTNLPFEQWTEVLGSERLTGAALDRRAVHFSTGVHTSQQSSPSDDAEPDGT